MQNPTGSEVAPAVVPITPPAVGVAPTMCLPAGAILNQLVRFDGQNMLLEDWAAHLKSTLRLYNLATDLQADVALNALEGDARRTIMLRPEEERKTLDAIFSILESIYGETSGTGTLRSRFFTRFQREDETIPQFANALQEIWAHIRKREASGANVLGNGDQILRDQFILGLRSPPLRQALRERILVDATLQFQRIQAEAVARDKEEAYGVHTVRMQAAGGQRTPSDGEDLREAVKELSAAMGEIQRQLTQLRASSMAPTQSDYWQESATSMGSPLYRSTRGARMRDSTRHWSGLTPSTEVPLSSAPIARNTRGPQCWICQERGHISRQCPQRGLHPEQPPLNGNPLQ